MKHIFKSSTGKIILIGAILLVASIFVYYLYKQPNPFQITLESGGLEFVLIANASLTVDEFLKESGIKLNKEDLVLPDSNLALSPGSRIIIKRATPVILYVDGVLREILTQTNTIEELLKEQNISLGPEDRTEPNLLTQIIPELKIVVIRVKEVIIKEMAPIPFPRKFQEDSEMLYGKEQIIKPGKNGKKEQTFRVRYENGEETKRTLLSEKTIIAPQLEIARRGTKIFIGRIQEGLASWYCPTYSVRIKTGLTCASRDFPKGTFLRVTNLSNGKSVIVEVTDWVANPKVIIDLWCDGFKLLAPLWRGIIPVRVEEIL